MVRRTGVGSGIRLLQGIQEDTEGGQMARSRMDLGREVSHGTTMPTSKVRRARRTTKL